MARQVNNIARMPWDIRRIVCRMSFEGATNADIAKAVKAECERLGVEYRKVHGSSLLAYREGTEYREYCDAKRAYEAKMRPRRWAAEMLNEGRGPESLADVAEMEILEQLHDLASGGLLETGKDVATVARAITSLQRTQLARRQEDADEQIEALQHEHTAQCAEYEAEIRRLRSALAEAGVEPDAERDQDGGLSDAALRQIEERAKLL